MTLQNFTLGTFAQQGVAAAAGSFESIASTTVGAGGAATITFSSIPSTYAHLQIRGAASMTDSTGVRDAQIQFNNDSGANYSRHWLYSFGSSVNAANWANESSIKYGYVSGTDTGSDVRSALIIDILDYANTNKYKTTRNLSGNDRVGSGGNRVLVFSSGAWYSTSAVSTITITLTSGDFAQYSHFALYGIKAA